MFAFLRALSFLLVQSFIFLKLHVANHYFKFSESFAVFEPRKNFNSEVVRKIPEKLYLKFPCRECPRGTWG